RRVRALQTQSVGPSTEGPALVRLSSARGQQTEVVPRFSRPLPIYVGGGCFFILRWVQKQEVCSYETVRRTEGPRPGGPDHRRGDHRRDQRGQGDLLHRL